MKKIFLLIVMFLTGISFSYAENVSSLKSINIMKSSYSTVINITLSDSVTFNEGKLTDNNKIYLDLKNTIINEPLKIDVNSNYVSAVRSAQNATVPEYITRVVFDMDKMTDYKIETYDNKSINVIFEELGSTNITTPVEVVDTTSRGQITRPANNAVNKKLIVIDAGHGGNDPGAVFDSILEKSLNLDIAKRLRKLLEAEGYEVIMTRTTDEYVELAERAAIANRNNAGLFISIHNNSMPDGYKGTMTLYSTRDIQNGFSSKNLADAIQKNMEQSLETGSIGARERTNLAVLNQTTMPAVIAEVACMSNPKELGLLKTAVFRQSAAQGICDAIMQIEF